MTERDLDTLFQLVKAPVSIDRKAWLLETGHIQEVSFGDLIEDTEAVEPEDIVMSKMLQQILVHLFDLLTEREAGIIQLRFGLGD
ncbi:RNA polymerase principal sigma factor hrdB [Jonesia denitrificans]|nr:RNA polymerase principal sigma factor hrdB [Jonesia denitrificans]